uniref:Uncharacterized protein n=1 Tax=Glossina pallidipes TaxID=7398 RepID=A0A1B0A9P7_GLOPL
MNLRLSTRKGLKVKFFGVGLLCFGVAPVENSSWDMGNADLFLEKSFQLAHSDVITDLAASLTNDYIFLTCSFCSIWDDREIRPALYNYVIDNLAVISDTNIVKISKIPNHTTCYGNSDSQHFTRDCSWLSSTELLTVGFDGKLRFHNIE